MIVVNFKNFRSGVGNGAIGLARICEKVGKECGVEIVAAVSALDVSDVSRDVGIGVWLQHVDGVEYGAYSGWILPHQLFSAIDHYFQLKQGYASL